METGLGKLLAGKDLPDIRTYSPGALAYIGDGVYELFVRTKLLSEGNRPADELQRQGVRFSKAVSQAACVDALLEEGFFSEEELAVYKRGRNTDTHSHTRNASHADYQKATGLECLFGFLYLSGRDERLLELFHAVIRAAEEQKK